MSGKLSEKEFVRRVKELLHGVPASPAPSEGEPVDATPSEREAARGRLLAFVGAVNAYHRSEGGAVETAKLERLEEELVAALLRSPVGSERLRNENEYLRLDNASLRDLLAARSVAAGPSAQALEDAGWLDNQSAQAGVRERLDRIAATLRSAPAGEPDNYPRPQDLNVVSAADFQRVATRPAGEPQEAVGYVSEGALVLLGRGYAWVHLYAKRHAGEPEVALFRAPVAPAEQRGADGEEIAAALRWYLGTVEHLHPDSPHVGVVRRFLARLERNAPVGAPDPSDNDRVHYLLTMFNLWSSEGTFTFPDGLTWYKDRSNEVPPQQG